FHFALLGRNAVTRRIDRMHVACANSRESRALRAVNVCNAATSEVALDGTGSFLFDLGPRGIRNRSQLAMQVIHWNFLLSRNLCRANHPWMAPWRLTF